MPAFFRKNAYKIVSALICAAAVAAAGCHGQGNISYYGIAWVDLTTEHPGNFTSYVVTIDSVTLTRSDGIVVTAVGTPEVIDLTQVHNIAEMWSSGSIPDGQYVSATITVDYTTIANGGTSAISVMVAGKPVAATVLDAGTGAAPTTYSITTNFDPSHQPNITPTYASTSASLINVDYDLAASSVVDLSTSPPTVRIRPFMSIGTQAADNKLIRVRGPLINSSVDVQTYTVYIRPFYDEANNIGSLTLFSQPSTIYTLNGNSYLGSDGLGKLSVLSAGTTLTAGYTTFQTDYNAANGATAGRFNLVYVVAGSTLEDIYTEGISGDVIARSGDTATLLGSTLFLNTADTFTYETAPTQLLLGPQTIVTADDSTTLTNLTASAVSVGQHIVARGRYNILADGTVQIDATGATATNTGSVRLQNTEVFGTLTAAGSGSLTMDAQTIDNFPVSDFDFAGNGAAAVNPAAFTVATDSIGLPAGLVAGNPVWVSGYTAPFGSAPPDFDAVAVNSETSVQVAGGQAHGGASTTPGTQGCGVGSQVCDPAKLNVVWSSTTAPFADLSAAGFSLNLTHATSAVIDIGPEVIELATAPAVTVVPTSLTVTSTFAPRYTVGDPVNATTTPTVTAVAGAALESFSSFPSWVTTVTSELSATTPALQLTASGIYDRATGTFTATSIDLVL